MDKICFLFFWTVAAWTARILMMDPIATVQSLVGLAIEIRRRLEQADANLADLAALLQRVEDILAIVVPLDSPGPEVSRALEVLNRKLEEAMKLTRSVDRKRVISNAIKADTLGVAITDVNLAVDRVVSLLQLAVGIAAVVNPDRRNRSNLFNLGYCLNAIDMKSAGLTHHDFPVAIKQQALEGVLLYCTRFRSFAKLLGLQEPQFPSYPRDVTPRSVAVVIELVASAKQFTEGVVVPTFNLHVPYVQLGMDAFLFEIQPSNHSLRESLRGRLSAVGISNDQIDDILSKPIDVISAITRTIMDTNAYASARTAPVTNMPADVSNHASPGRSKKKGKCSIM